MPTRELRGQPLAQGPSGIATQSGWDELGLALGVPMLTLIFCSLLLSFLNAIRGAYTAKMTILGFIAPIISLYTVGEVAIDHGLEILFFFLAQIPSLMLTMSLQTTDEKTNFEKVLAL
jgi:hypothetical protein